MNVCFFKKFKKFFTYKRKEKKKEGRIVLFLLLFIFRKMSRAIFLTKFIWIIDYYYYFIFEINYKFNFDVWKEWKCWQINVVLQFYFIFNIYILWIKYFDQYSLSFFFFLLFMNLFFLFVQIWLWFYVLISF